jgi:hypothetical protein
MKRWTKACAAVGCAVALLGSGAVLVRPAAAAVGIDWGSVWRHRLQPRADHRYYTRARADHRFAPKPRVLRGEFNLEGNAATGDEILSGDISWGWNIGRAPRVHVIPLGGKRPHGCFGSVGHPNARRGNLCIFTRYESTNSDPLAVCSADNECPGADPWGAGLVSFAHGPGLIGVDGSYAVRPARHVRAARSATSEGPLGPLGR